MRPSHLTVVCAARRATDAAAKLLLLSLQLLLLLLRSADKTGQLQSSTFNKERQRQHNEQYSIL